MISYRAASAADQQSVRDFYAVWDYHREISEDSWVLIALDGDTVVGIVRLQVDEGVTVLRGMRVLPEYQRQGIGSAMLDRLALQIGATPCYCVPYRHLTGFYGRIGFAEANLESAPAFLRRRVADYRDEGMDAILMLRPAATP